MNQRLSEQDIKELRYQLRPRFAIPILFAFLVFPIVFFIFHTYELEYSKGELLIVFFVLLSISILVGYLLSRTYLSDIQSGEKKVETKKIQKKVSKVDYEAVVEHCISARK